MKIGLILSHGGLAGIWTLGCQGAALLAAAELNAAGGVLGQEIEIIPVDSGATQASAFRAAQGLVLALRLYDTPLTTGTGVANVPMPEIRRGTCR